MSGLRDLFAVPPLPNGDTDYDRNVRSRELYNLELKKGVELGRKLGAFEARYGKLRTHITDLVNRAVVKGGASPQSPTIIAFRNAVRIMKGKNKL